jgi:hypothetical protein
MYFSGSAHRPKIVELLTSKNVYRLFTFASPEEVHPYLEYCDQNGRTSDIMIDSGAFTSWNIGKVMQLKDLIDYNHMMIARYPQHRFVFIALDKIPGSRGRTATESEIASAVEESYFNFVTMLQEFPNHKVLPVYHSGEDKFIRDRYLSHVPYICLSMNQNLDESQRVKWATEAYVPGFDFHGLAATGNRMLSQVNWFSVDSSSWIVTAAMGAILYPFGTELRPLAISKDSSLRHDMGKHYLNMSPTEREYVDNFIRSKGYDPDSMTTHYIDRMCWNIERWNDNLWVKKIVEPNMLFD